MIFILMLIGGIILLFLYSSMKVSSECSRKEEERELLWLQQEYGKSKKD